MAGEATGYSQTHTQGYLGSLDAYQCCCGGSLSHERLGDRTPGSGDAAVPSEKLRSRKPRQPRCDRCCGPTYVCQSLLLHCSRQRHGCCAAHPMICCTCSGFFPLPFGAGRAALRSFPVLIGEFTI